MKLFFYSLFILLLFGCTSFFLLNLQKKPIQVSADLLHEVENITLKVQGEIPEWIKGTLVRNGPINITVNGKTNQHWFDGLAMLHAFSFNQGNVSYCNKFLRSDAHRSVFKEGSLNYPGFASDPCKSLFKTFFNLLIPADDDIPNANVNVCKISDAYVALTETPLPVKFDLKTLKTLGILDFQDALPEEHAWASAHPHPNSEEKTSYNYLVQFGESSDYVIYYLKDGSSERKVIAEIPVLEPAYMHSFAVTENYIILTEFPLVVNPLDLILGKQAFIKNYKWKPEKGTTFIVISKKDGKVKGRYNTRPFFAFHHANAYEEGDLIHLDLVTYDDASIVTSTAFDVNLKQRHPKIFPTQLQRFTLNLGSGMIDSKTLFSGSHEFPRINERFDGKPYKFVYTAGFFNYDGTEGIYKIDTTTGKALEWNEKNCCSGEPVFVASPNAKEEDEGVILAVVMDLEKKNSFLLVLDAKDFKEIARAYAPHLIPEGLHGQFFDS